MNRRYMHNPTSERRVIHALIWLTAACVIAALLTSCSPYADVSNALERTATPSPSATVTESPTGWTFAPTPRPSCTVTTGLEAGRVNMRTGPGTNYAVIRVLIEAERLTVLTRGAWLEVTAQDGKRGFIYARYCHD